MFELKPPLYSMYPPDWGEFADWLEEKGDPNAAYIHTIHRTLRVFAERQADPRRLCLRGVQEERQRRLNWHIVPPATLARADVVIAPKVVWVKHPGATTWWHLGVTEDEAAAKVCCPCHIEGLPARAPEILWAYFRRLVGDAEGSGWLS